MSVVETAPRPGSRTASGPSAGAIFLASSGIERGAVAHEALLAMRRSFQRDGHEHEEEDRGADGRRDDEPVGHAEGGQYQNEVDEVAARQRVGDRATARRPGARRRR